MSNSTSIEVRVNPATAFTIFIDEIDRWWRPGPVYAVDADRAVGQRIERGLGGRWLELYDPFGDDAYSYGEITSWEPGQRVVFACRSPSIGEGTTVTVQFTANDTGSTVRLIHDDWGRRPGGDDQGLRDAYASAWDDILGWYREWADWGSPTRIAERPAAPAYVLRPGAGTVSHDPALKASRRSTLGSMSVMQSTTTGGAPSHVHVYDDEAFFVLAGTMTIDMDGSHHELGAGGFAFVPRGTTHAWDTIGEATVLIVTAPGGIEEFLHELHTGGTGYAETWRRIGPRYGYELR